MIKTEHVRILSTVSMLCQVLVLLSIDTMCHKQEEGHVSLKNKTIVIYIEQYKKKRIYLLIF